MKLLQKNITVREMPGDQLPTLTPHTGSINNGGAMVRGHQSNKREKYNKRSWCLCSWMLSCFRKDDPPVGATTFENEAPPVPDVCNIIKYLYLT